MQQMWFLIGVCICVCIGLFIFYQKYQESLVAQLSQVCLYGKEALAETSPPEIIILDRSLQRCKNTIKKISENSLNSKQVKHQLQICQNLVVELTKEIGKRQNYISIVKEANKHEKEKYYKKALLFYKKAITFYSLSELTEAISRCKDQAYSETVYELALKEAEHNAIELRAKAAINILEKALDQFSRLDGHNKLQQIKVAYNARQMFRKGLQAEKQGNLNQALNFYECAGELDSQILLYKIRLATVAIKLFKWETAISVLQNEKGETTSYLRGFAQAKLGNFKQASIDWKSHQHIKVQEQYQVLNQIFQRQQLFSLRGIELAVKENNLLRAEMLSKKHLKEFGADDFVETNLHQHIIPRVMDNAWKNGQWDLLLSSTLEKWHEYLSSDNLHNWAVANYYYAVNEINNISEVNIYAWTSAVVNLSSDPIFKSSWLESKNINFDELTSLLVNTMEVLIDKVKEDNLEKYLQLRDIWRNETHALNFLVTSQAKVPRINQLLLLPGCYRSLVNLRLTKSFKELANDSISTESWATLYTDWGPAVSACLAGDIPRAIKIRPSKSPVSSLETYARSIINYHEGCYFLANDKWRSAIKPLNAIKSILEVNTEWQVKLNQLCVIQKDSLDDANAISFADFWYNLISTKQSKDFYVETQVKKISKQLIDEKASWSNLQKSLTDLRGLQKISQNNEILLNIISVVETEIEMMKINELLDASSFEEAFQVAKRSSNPKVRFIMAERCINVILKSYKNPQMEPELLAEFGRLAYSLCPNEPSFQPIYSAMGIIRY